MSVRIFESLINFLSPQPCYKWCLHFSHFPFQSSQCYHGLDVRRILNTTTTKITPKTRTTRAANARYSLYVYFVSFKTLSNVFVLFNSFPVEQEDSVTQSPSTFCTFLTQCEVILLWEKSREIKFGF